MNYTSLPSQKISIFPQYYFNYSIEARRSPIAKLNFATGEQLQTIFSKFERIVTERGEEGEIETKERFARAKLNQALTNQSEKKVRFRVAFCSLIFSFAVHVL